MRKRPASCGALFSYEMPGDRRHRSRTVSHAAAEIAYETETSFAETTLLGDTSTTPASPSAGASM